MLRHGNLSSATYNRVNVGWGFGPKTISENLVYIAVFLLLQGDAIPIFRCL